MPRQRIEGLRRTLARYEEQAEAHHQAAETAQKVRSEAGYTHQMELEAWYEREAEKLKREITKRERRDRADE